MKSSYARFAGAGTAILALVVIGCSTAQAGASSRTTVIERLPDSQMLAEITWLQSRSSASPQSEPPANCADLDLKGLSFRHIVLQHVACAAAYRVLRGWLEHTEPGQHGTYKDWRFTSHAEDPSIAGTWRASRHRHGHPAETITFTLASP